MLSIIIPVFNQLEMTQECIEAVLKSTNTISEFIIIDNGSEPHFTLPAMGNIEVTVIRNEENLGFPVAVNQGIRVAKGDIICLLNNDVIVTPGWADKLISWLDKYDIVSPCTNFASGLQSVDIGVYEDNEELAKEAALWAKENKNISEEVNWVIGFVFMFKKALYEELGAFDEALWPCCGEEIDFCLRAKEAGKKCGIARDVYVHHHGSQTFAAINEEHSYNEINKRNVEHLTKRWGHFPQSEGGRRYSGK